MAPVFRWLPRHPYIQHISTTGQSWSMTGETVEEVTMMIDTASFTLTVAQWVFICGASRVNQVDFFEFVQSKRVTFEDKDLHKVTVCTYATLSEELTWTRASIIRNGATSIFMRLKIKLSLERMYFCSFSTLLGVHCVFVERCFYSWVIVTL